MKGWLALAAVGLMLGVPAATGASYTQPGNGPERTGAIDFLGPQTNDTAFEVHLPGVPFGTPSVIDGQAYIVTLAADAWTDYEGATDGLTETALWRLDLSTGETERILDAEDRTIPIPFGGLTAERAMFIDFGTEELFNAEIASGEELWRVRPMPEDPRDHRGYNDLARVGNTLYIAFTAWGVDAPETPVGSTTVGLSPSYGLMAIDAGTGEAHWTRTINIQDDNFPPICCMSLAADEDHVYVYLRRGGDVEDITGGVGAGGEGVSYSVYESQYEIRAYSANGGFLWNRSDTAQQRVGVYTSRAGIQPLSAQGWGCCAYPAVADTAVHIRLDSFEAINPATGESVWTSEAGRSDQVQSQGSGGMGVRGDVAVATSTQTVYRLDATDGDMVWQNTETDQWYAGLPVTLDGDTAYVPLSWLGDDCFLDIGMEARDLETGKLLWRWWHESAVGRDNCGSNLRSADPGFGPGVMVWGDKDGTVTVLGTTNASLGAPPPEAEMYPPEGEEITLEVPEPEPGAFGPATRYKVDWGDGTISDWQDRPVFNHTYQDAETVQAHLMAGNEANQTSRTIVTMNVGQEAPTEPNWISERFAPGNQDMTFGILGILVAATGGAVGVTQRYRKRSRLQDELEAVEQAYEATKDRPLECEAQLTERKTHARGLVLDGELDEQQFGVVEQRIEELLKGVRMGAMEDEFDFLPHGLVKRAREMLADGTVSSLEREAFLQAVEEDEMLSSRQKAVVRDRIEAWHARDAGTGAGGR